MRGHRSLLVTWQHSRSDNISTKKLIKTFSTVWERLTLYKACALQAESVQYRLRVFSTGWGTSEIQTEGMQYRLRVFSTGWGTSEIQTEGMQYRLRHIRNTDRGHAVQSEGVQYRLRHIRNTDRGHAVQAEGVQYRLRHIRNTDRGNAVQAEAHPKYRPSACSTGWGMQNHEFPSDCTTHSQLLLHVLYTGCYFWMPFLVLFSKLYSQNFMTRSADNMKRSTVRWYF